MRDAFAALLLAVLIVVGGAPADYAVLPVRGLTGHAPGAALPGPELPGSAPGPAPANTATVITALASPTAGAALAAGTRSDRRSVPPGLVVSAPAEAAASAWPAETAPAPGPRAGSDRPHAPQHFPPPGHGALPPRAPALLVPRAVRRGVAGAVFRAPGRSRTKLPGVRGPPTERAGQPALRRSCSTDPSSRTL
ncbi:hypothetical protein [Streptomyces sp. B1I3]|uniref:hypothetical protein n=1 Tax=Streptomyces sp. B1I3 TaxID=3042264 RepID=UPI0027D929F1|nr:hypothetical protein [Streptomyces sp. B1I3]